MAGGVTSLPRSTSCGSAARRIPLRGRAHPLQLRPRARRLAAQARAGVLASRIPSSQLSRNKSFSTVKKKLVLQYTSALRLSRLID